MLPAFCEWLAGTTFSAALHESVLMYPLVESIHVWTLALFVGFAFALDVRLLGLALRRVRVSELTRRLLPWTTAGFVVMAMTGVLLFAAIPVRTYHSVWFRGKVVMLILAGINVCIFHTGAYLRVAEWDLAANTPRSAKVAGLASIVLWSGIVIFGRMIAYSWFDCDKQPQPAVINWVAGCVLGPESP